MHWPRESATDRALRSSFERAAAGYEAAAQLAAAVAHELLQRLAPLALSPRVVLDLGAGTGLAAAQLKTRYRRATVVALDLSMAMLREARRHQRILRRFARVRGDAMRLPLATGSVDLIFCNLLLHWCEPRTALAEMSRVLRSDGLLVLSTVGPDTLKELRRAWAAADAEAPHVNTFLDMHDVGDLLLQAGFAEPVLDVERMQMQFPDVRSLARQLREVGASALAGRRRTLTGKGRLEVMRAAYEAERGPAGLPASIEIVHAVAWGAAAGQGARSAGVPGEVRISPAAIRTRR